MTSTNLWQRVRFVFHPNSGAENEVGALRLLGWGLAAVTLGLGAGLLTVLLPNPLVGFGLVTGLVGAGLLLTRPLFTLSLVLGVACLFPFGVIPLKLGLTFSLLEASLLALFLVWLASIATHKPGREQVVSTPFNWAIWLFVGLCLFTFVLGWNNYADLITTVHNFARFLLATLSFFAIINLVRTQAAIEMLLRVLILAGSGAALLGVGLYRLPTSLQERLLLALRPFGYPVDRVLRYVEDDVSQPQRATSTSVDPNSFAGMLVLIMALIFTQLVSSKPLFRRWQLGLMFGVSGVAVILTYSRAAQLGVLAVIVFVATLKYRRIWLYALPAIGAALVILPQTPLLNRFAGGFALKDPATLMRLHEYSNALDVIQHYPWFGVGFVGFSDHAPLIDLTTGVSMIYLTIAERMGLIGLLGYLLVMFLFFVYALSGLRRIQDVRQAACLLGFVGGIVGALSVGFLDFYYFDIQFAHMAALFWITMGLAVAQIKVAVVIQNSHV